MSLCRKSILDLATVIQRNISPTKYIVGIDPGTKFTGLAIADCLNLVPAPLLVTSNVNFCSSENAYRLSRLNIVALVVGKNYMSNIKKSRKTHSSVADQLGFKDTIECVYYHDERYSSALVNSMTGQHLDSLSAFYILDEALEMLKRFNQELQQSKNSNASIGSLN